ncbi:MAG: 50S ribosomal protein L4 [Myxococcales bacterium]|nr:50S ribosomal protein L4 [Myxococcales bacterium]MCB9519920.1 50S ribosomal protein L4 [Myxococcales bacterium]MCB9533173.1 50S ribosomal protein L4 [Myxococcales bacterium]
MKLDVYNLENTKVGEITVSDEVFAAAVKPHLHHEVVRWQLAKRRAGTHKTKGRSEVSRSGKKVYKQKGTGNARHGNRRSPVYVGGGTIHGPLPRSYDYTLPKKVKRGALRSVLSMKASEGRIKVVDAFAMAEPKTRQAAATLTRLGADRALVVDTDNESLKLSVRNLPKSKFVRNDGLNVRDLIHYDTLVITRSALEAIDGVLKS